MLLVSALMLVSLASSSGESLQESSGKDPIKALLAADAPAGKSPKSYETGLYRSLFRESGKSEEEIKAKLNAAWNQLFYGNDENERVYYPLEDGTAYIKDVGNDDVRSEGMSYGMMLAVQLDRRDEFNRLWRWTKKHMLYKEGPMKGYFAWQCAPDGTVRGKTPASDGEEYFAMALFFAAGRWGAEGGVGYRAEADAILHAMLHRERENGGVVAGVTDMFNRKERQVVFVPSGDAATFTDPSYHLPAFYELWSRWAKEDRGFWKDATATSRKFFRRAAHPQTGLFPDYAGFDGKPKKAPWDPKSQADNFMFDAFRVGGNIATDHAWFGSDSWQVEQTDRMLNFFAAQKPGYVGNYTLDGKPLADFKPAGLIAMNATATLAATKPSPDFVKDLWEAPIPNGKWRYYDGLLYMFGLLQASGQYRIWEPVTRI